MFNSQIILECWHIILRSVCMYVCACAHRHGERVHVYACGSQRVTSWVFLALSSSFSERRSLTEAGVHWVSRLVTSKCRGPPGSRSPVRGFQGHFTALGSFVGAGIRFLPMRLNTLSMQPAFNLSLQQSQAKGVLTQIVHQEKTDGRSEPQNHQQHQYTLFFCDFYSLTFIWLCFFL